MPKSVYLDRRALRETIARESGVGKPLSQVYAGQPAQAAAQAEFWALPVDNTLWQPLGVTDPGSPNYGRTYYIPGLHTPGDPNHPMR